MTIFNEYTEYDVIVCGETEQTTSIETTLIKILYNNLEDFEDFYEKLEELNNKEEIIIINNNITLVKKNK